LLGLKSNYPEYYAYINQIDFNADSADYSYFDTFDPNIGYYMMFDDYSNMVNKYVMYKLSKEIKMDDFQAKPALERFEQMFSIIDTNITNAEIRDYLKHNELIEELQFGKFYEYGDVVNKFIADCKTDGYKNKISGIYNNKMKLAPGKPAPMFKYKDIKGKEFGLEDFKGKLVYIDFWATWCGPCKHELPYLETLQDEYKGKKIVFISLSVDDDMAAWENMVKEKKMKGVQLHADGAWASTAAVEYQVKGIPTFYMIDGNSNILVPNAPRPSSEEIRPLIDENLKKL
jgi:thiol-disulfide isomerase/thioredoxin